MPTERRQSARSDIFLVIEFSPFNTSTYSQGVSENISLEGLSFDSASHDSRIGEILELKIKDPDSYLSLAVLGEIIWKRELWYKCMTGVKFKDIDKDTENKIAELVSAVAHKHAGLSVSDKEDKSTETSKEEKRPAASLDSSREEELHSAILGENNNASFEEAEEKMIPSEDSSAGTSMIADSIDKVIDKTAAREIDDMKVRDLNRKESEDEKLKIPDEPMKFSWTAAESKDQRRKRRLFITLISILMIAAAVILSFKFDNIKQLLLTHTPTTGPLPLHDTIEQDVKVAGNNAAPESVTGPEQIELIQLHEILDINKELPEEEIKEDSEPALTTSASSQDNDNTKPSVDADSAEPDSSMIRGRPLLIPDLEVTITFDKNSVDVNPWFFPEIDKISNALFNYPESKVKVTGHTDSVGLTSYNMDLSVRRAVAVKELLDDTEIGRIRNRRVEIKFIPSYYSESGN
jgi:outer membrane protein OmpA-like peptidoglycan-associated protein